MEGRQLHQPVRALPVLPGRQQGSGGGQQFPPVILFKGMEHGAEGFQVPASLLSPFRRQRVNRRALQVLILLLRHLSVTPGLEGRPLIQFQAQLPQAGPDGLMAVHAVERR